MVASSARVGLQDAAQVAVIGISGRVNIRAEPSIRSAVIGHARAATRLDTDGCVLRLERLWCGVRWERGAGRRGWVAAEYLLPVDDALPPVACDVDEGTLCSVPQRRSGATYDLGIDVEIPYGPPYLRRGSDGGHREGPNRRRGDHSR
ncbi:hypothetical protein OCH239_20560 [Roseivivax halodurans JCM 10272]|uniref:SH3b domain-containing protein n=1 Tax=Roseivivax halodurans JCM 10272 TaxID=1449350 RepID=X7EG72_9RHOB|nr:SH3 domain-containing protein [Roseivivax halodurans]ETX14887.1 hypothetical protein OCH239_20560 [Roseivivax halodurans JCM 10272]